MVTDKEKTIRPVILCFVSYYLPGYKSGGPVRTIANMIEYLGDEFDFHIVTRDRDLLDIKSYENVLVDSWNTVGNVKVFYASKKSMTLYGVAQLLQNNSYDTLYLNSFFDFNFTILPLLALRMRLTPRCATVIAPRGELSVGAIALGRFKKKSFLFLSGVLGLYKGLCWQASSEFEKNDINRELGNLSPRVNIAEDLASKINPKQLAANAIPARNPGPLRLIFLSRISPMKNIDYLLCLLRRVIEPVQLSIFGPIEDKDYWCKCKMLMQKLPPNIVVRYKGDLKPEQVHLTFSQYDVFAFPTRGENFGHVIFESLSAGTPVIVSDQTPWEVDVNSALTVVPLNDQDGWTKKIEDWAHLSANDFHKSRKEALIYATNYYTNNKSVEHNRQLFLLRKT